MRYMSTAFIDEIQIDEFDCIVPNQAMFDLFGHVEQETDDKMFLASINKKYFFWVLKTNDPNWNLIK
jgi:hypothetical protein